MEKEELTSLCCFLKHVYYSYLHVYYYLYGISLRYVHYKELRVFAPFEEGLYIAVNKDEFDQEEFFFSPANKVLVLKGSSWQPVYSSFHKEV